MAKINKLTNVHRFSFKRAKIIGVRAIPPFLRLKPVLDIDQSRHRPVIGCYKYNSYLNLSHENGNACTGTIASDTVLKVVGEL